MKSEIDIVAECGIGKSNYCNFSNLGSWNECSLETFYSSNESVGGVPSSSVNNISTSAE